MSHFEKQPGLRHQVPTTGDGATVSARLERRLERWLRAEGSSESPRRDTEHALRRVFQSLPQVVPPAAFAERVVVAARASQPSAGVSVAGTLRAAVLRHWLPAAALLASLWFGALIVGSRLMPEPEVVDGTMFAASRVGFSFLEVVTGLLQGFERAAEVGLAALSMALSGEALLVAALLTVTAFSALYVLVRSSELAS